MTRLFTFCATALVMFSFIPREGKESYSANTLIFNYDYSLSASGKETHEPAVGAKNEPSPYKGIISYPADLKAGLIGAGIEQPVDDPADNIFHIYLPDNPTVNQLAFLSYRLFGLGNQASVAESINDAQAVGGQVIQLSTRWSVQRVSIPVNSLHAGDNIVRFDLPDNAKISYKVKEVSVQLEPASSSNEILVNSAYAFGGRTYVSGIIRLKEPATLQEAKLFCNDQPVRLIGGVFEVLADSLTGRQLNRAASLRLVLANGKTVFQQVQLKLLRGSTTIYPSQLVDVTSTENETTSSSIRTTMSANTGYATVKVPLQSIPGLGGIKITALRDIDLPELGPDLINVTRGAKGFRLSPHVAMLGKAAAVAIPYDSSLIPEGYSPADIHSYYFDTKLRQWVDLPLDTLDSRQGIVHSFTTHLDDIINGIVRVAESPLTQSDQATSIKDIKAADASAGITFIEPPTAGSGGNASFSYSLKIPGGRAGMQPSLGLQYNNEGGNGWMGLGWNLSAPSVGIDTRWGVPRFDTGLETETYTLNGEQLAPLANRSAFVKRNSAEKNKKFNLRVEGSFSKIIRHGDSPRNYWWEVTAKNGTTTCYGGVPDVGVVPGAVLKDDEGNIAQWLIVESRDLNNNFVHYLYEQLNHTGIIGGKVQGRQIYLKRILYTGSGNTDGAYQVEFTRDTETPGETKRKDVIINCRLGFKMVTAEKLSGVRISLGGQTIRSYKFNYTVGAFSKTLLASVSELDATGEVFYAHSFEYNDDVKFREGYKPFGEEQAWRPGSDNLSGDLKISAPGFTGEGSALNTMTSENTGGGLGITVGPPGDATSKNESLGGTFGYSEDDSEGLVMMLDIDGDGRPDKVFKKNGKLFYRRNLGPTAKSFGEAIQLGGSPVSFSQTNSKNISWGLQGIADGINAGFSRNKTTTRTSVYFEDINNDGHVDLAYNGTIFFNRPGDGHVPNFQLGSAGTANQITAGAAVNDVFSAASTNIQKEQEAQFPLQDIVRVWQAPFSGDISISGDVILQQTTDTGKKGKPLKKDGVFVSIEQGGVEKWSFQFSRNHYEPQPPAAGLLHVDKGDRIYFRVQSLYNGEGDLVKWDPEIRYRTVPSPALNADNKPSFSYRASEDFYLHSEGRASFLKNGTIHISSLLKKKYTSDDITLQVMRKTGNTRAVAFSRRYPNNLSKEDSVNFDIAVTTSDTLFFLVHSDSHIDCTAVDWSPYYEYTSYAPGDNSPLHTLEGKPIISARVVPDHSNYNDWIKKTQPFVVDELMEYEVLPVFPNIFTPGVDEPVTLTVKGRDTIYGKRILNLKNGVVQNVVDAITFTPRFGELIYCEYNTHSRVIPETRIDPLTGSTDIKVLVNHFPRDAGFYTEPKIDYFGPLYRGWGGFSFKGDISNKPLVESKLNLNEFKEYDTDVNKFRDSADISKVKDPSKANFIMLYADPYRNVWRGNDSSVYLDRGFASSSRLWLHDVAVDKLFENSAVQAIDKISSSSSDSYTFGVNPGYFGLNESASKTSGATDLDVRDMNGDGYPDIVNGEFIQHTLPTGGFSNQITSNSAGPAINSAESAQISADANLTPAVAGVLRLVKLPNLANSVAKASISADGNFGTNSDKAEKQLTDINGDGLPDMLFEDGSVALNMGYYFSQPEHWTFSSIETNSTISGGTGVGIGGGAILKEWGKNYVSGSIQAGFGLSRSTVNNNKSFVDVNGDGLPDICVKGNNNSVQINTGAGFEAPVTWTGMNLLTKNVSIGSSLNAAFTIGINIVFIRICINPSFTYANSVSRREEQVMDIDGDGFPDLLSSDGDDKLKVQLSAIGRTNMLTRVNRPMGSYFTLDYEKSGNTFDMPQNKWVLKSVELFDGLTGDGADLSRKEFSYAGGYYDRHEREFFGFNSVVSKDINTMDGNKVYRSTVEVFQNTSYYNKELLVSERTEDALGNKYRQTDNTYSFRGVTDSVIFPALTGTRVQYFEGQSQAGVSSFTGYDYDEVGNLTNWNDAGDGTQEDSLTAIITYHNIDGIYLKSVPSGITVRNSRQELLRKRTTTIDDRGNIVEIQKFLNDNGFVRYDMEYDGYGNLAKITHPANHRGQRMWYTYVYDNTVHTYPVRISDAFGYFSSSEYDYRFGVAVSTVSMQGQPSITTLDSKGRISTVAGPYEIASGKPYRIAFDYFPGAKIPFAITRHYDPEHDDDIRTIAFMDGLGRPVEVKKQVSIFAGKDQPDLINVVTTGRQQFDAFGRATKVFYPTTEPSGSNDTSFTSQFGILQSRTVYDVEDRPLSVKLADSSVTDLTYTAVGQFFITTINDALRNVSQTLTDIKQRKRETRLNTVAGTISTKFYYNPVNDLLRVVDTRGNTTEYTYDNLGRRLSTKHPDNGLTTFTYDDAGNLTKRTTAQIRKEMPPGTAILYQYDFERLTDIDYPKYYQNKVKYTYGKPGMGTRTGRLILQQDASGGQEFFYGKLGEITKNIRTMIVNPAISVTYISEQSFDTWNRMTKMIYPDGEEVSYHYNRVGNLRSMEGSKLGNTYKYVTRLGYDEYDQRTYLRYGNGTETKYSYDSARRRLSTLNATTPRNRQFMKNVYTYDPVGNVLGIENNIAADTGKLGGHAQQSYKYDELYRLTEAAGNYTGLSRKAGYSLALTYDNLWNITSKRMLDSVPQKSYFLNYEYNGGSPHQPSKIGEHKYSYDANGNVSGSDTSDYFWDEENRMIAAISNGKLSLYTYDATGERALKSSSEYSGVWLNGAPAGSLRHNDDYTAYVSPYLVCRRYTFTKHYYIDGQRIVTKPGNGKFVNTSFPTPLITAGGINYISRADSIEKAWIAYLATIPAGPAHPTDKTYFIRPENNPNAPPPPVIIDNSATSAPVGWPQGNTTPPAAGGLPIYLPQQTRDEVKAGYGFDGTGHQYEKDQYFYHPDHLGSTSYVTDAVGELNQHFEYSAYGETFFEERSGEMQTPYLFNAKEKDDETGIYYYGARYYHPKTGQWMSVDPMAEKYPELSAYNFCLNNPVKLKDPNGKIPIDIIADVAFIAHDIYDIAKTYKKGEDISSDQWISLGLDVIGAAIPYATGLGKAAKAEKNILKIEKNAAKVEKEAAKNIRKEAIDLEEQLAMEEAKANPGEFLENTRDDKGKLKWSDKRLHPETGTHEKHSYSHEHPDGSVSEIHYEVDKKTKERSKFKFKTGTENSKSRDQFPSKNIDN